MGDLVRHEGGDTAAQLRRLQQALAKAEQQLASLTAHLPGILFQRLRRPDGSMSYRFLSDGVRDILDYGPEEMRLTPDGCLDAMHWADRELHRQTVAESARTLEPCCEEFRAITRDGEVRWLSGTARPQRLSDGAVLWDGLLVDVTERRRAEFRLELVLDHAADAIFTTDAAGRIESANAAAARLFGENLVGRCVAELMPEPHRRAHVERIARYVETADRELLVPAADLLGLRADGSTFPLELTASEVRMEGRRLFILIGRDVTRRHRAERALRETEARLGSIAINLPVIVFQRVLTAAGELRFPYVSDGARDILGLEPAAVTADSQSFLGALAPADQGKKYLAALSHSAASLQPMAEELRMVGPNGRVRWLRGHARPRRQEDGEVVWDGVLLDVTEQEEAEARLRFLAYYDSLTGLANRGVFRERLAEACRVAATESRAFAVMCLDIDRFGILNTTLGHSVGDRVLATAARRLQAAVRGLGTVARAGGDRFLVMVPRLADASTLGEVLERVAACWQEPLPLDGGDYDLSASMGVALFPRDGDAAETLLNHADVALMRAKTRGPGTIQMFSEEMSAAAAKTLSLQNRMRRALDNGEFVPFFQPQVDLATGAVGGVEALARWISPELGLVSPAEFIPVAEECGLIDILGEQILKSACRQAKAWQDAGLPPVMVAVNISGRQFQNPRRLLRMLDATLDGTGLDPSCLELELTESSAMRDAEAAIALIGMLGDRGIACAIDDFGTGYSSLSMLRRFPIHKLKIDRSFVGDVTVDSNDAAIVRAIVAMAQALRLTVVAEGVETAAQLDFVRQAGCAQIQGYLFSRPLPGAELETLLRAGKRLGA